MTSLLESIITVVAPHRCIVCSKYNNIVCETCVSQLAVFAASQCFLCAKPTAGFATCRSCRPSAALASVAVCSEYEQNIAALIKRFKFQRARTAARPLAQLLMTALEPPDPNTIIVPIPTAETRIRQRGYDHTLLLAEELSRFSGRPVRQLLARASNARQVGADRQQRQAQAASAFQAKGRVDQPILLLDDVLTTGSTLAAAAAALVRGGAGEVRAAVIARQS